MYSVKGYHPSLSAEPNQAMRERAFSDARQVSPRIGRNTGLVESSSLECPSPRPGRSFSTATMLSKSGAAYRKHSTTNLSRNSNKLTTDFLTSPWSSLESFYDIEDDSGISKEDVLCLMPTGIIFEISVHPDNVISNIKQLALDTAMNNGNRWGCFTRS